MRKWPASASYINLLLKGAIVTVIMTAPYIFLALLSLLSLLSPLFPLSDYCSSLWISSVGSEATFLLASNARPYLCSHYSEVWHPATNKVITDLQILHFIEIPKFERMQEQKKQQGVAMSRLDRWLQYLTCSDPQEVLAFAKADAIFGKVLEAEKMYINNKELMRKYYEENRDGYWEGVIANAKAEGKAEGKAEERQTLLAAARTLLAEGMDRLKVQRVMQLTDAEMASIC